MHMQMLFSQELKQMARLGASNAGVINNQMGPKSNINNFNTSNFSPNIYDNSRIPNS